MIFAVKSYLSCHLLSNPHPFPKPGNIDAADWDRFGRRVGSALALQRRSRGLSQQQVGEAIGVEPETISRMETGVISPSLKRLYQLSAVLDCSLEALLGGASAQPQDLLLALSKPLSVLTDRERAFVIDQSLSLASWLAAGREFGDAWPQGSGASRRDPLEWAVAMPYAVPVHDAPERSAQARVSQAAAKDDDPQI